MKFRFRVSVTWAIEANSLEEAQSRAENQVGCLGMDPEVELLGAASVQSLHVDSVGQASSSKMR